MAYFRCSTGSASNGDGVALVVTCDQNFAGSVITATNGTDTFTETCPSASPYTVRFEDIPVGTYTISGVAQGQTFTTQYTVLDYSTGLYSTPTGATVTPVNVIQTWLHCANIWDKTYTTISQVLADASTLQALIASNNAVDYMARSTSWASSVVANSNAMTYIGANNYCANKLLANATWCNAICNSTYMESVLNVKVPTMTSNTTPNGEVLYSNAYSSYPAYYAFDGNTSTSWGSNITDANGYIGYKFTKRIKVRKIAVDSYRYVSTNLPEQTFTLQGSNDNNAWTDIGTITLPQSTSSTNKVVNMINNNAYQYYRLKGKFTESWAANTFILVASLQFYGRE